MFKVSKTPLFIAMRSEVELKVEDMRLPITPKEIDIITINVLKNAGLWEVVGECIEEIIEETLDALTDGCR